MATEIEKIENNIAVKTKLLEHYKNLAAFYHGLAEEESPSTMLPIIQLLSDRMSHFSEYLELIKNDYNRIQPQLFTGFNQLKKVAELNDTINGYIDSLKKKITENAQLLEKYQEDNLALKIQNLYEEVTIDDKKIPPINESLNNEIIKDRVVKIAEYSVNDLSKIDINESNFLDTLITDSQHLSSHIVLSENDLQQQQENLVNEIDQLNQQKLQLEFEQQITDLQEPVEADAEPDMEIEDIIDKELKNIKDAKKEALTTKEEAFNTALVASQTAVAEVAVAKNELALLQQFDQLSTVTVELSNSVSDALTNLKSRLTKLKTNIVNNKIKNFNDLLPEVEANIAKLEGIEELHKEAVEKDSQNDLLSEMQGIEANWNTQKDSKVALDTLINELGVVVVKIRKTQKVLNDGAATILTKLITEYKASKFGKIEDGVKALNVGADAQKALATRITQKETVKSNAEQEVADKDKELAVARRAFETASILYP